MLRKLFCSSHLLLLLLLSLPLSSAAFGQEVFVSSFTASTTTPIDGEPVTLTATLGVYGGPTSALNGLCVGFQTLNGTVNAPISNGVATTTMQFGCTHPTHGCQTEVFASFVSTGSFVGVSGGMLSILAATTGYLDGQYAFIFQGYAGLGGAPSAVVAVGSLTFVNGDFTGGVEDVNNGLGSFQRVALTGSITLVPRSSSSPNNSSQYDLVLSSSLGTQHVTTFPSYMEESPNGNILLYALRNADRNGWCGSLRNG